MCKQRQIIKTCGNPPPNHTSRITQQGQEAAVVSEEGKEQTEVFEWSEAKSSAHPDAHITAAARVSCLHPSLDHNGQL
jgi:hypothetical protein